MDPDKGDYISEHHEPDEYEYESEDDYEYESEDDYEPDLWRCSECFGVMGPDEKENCTCEVPF